MKGSPLYFHIHMVGIPQLDYLNHKGKLVSIFMNVGNQRSEVSKIWSIPSHRGRHHEEIQKNNMGIINDNQCHNTKELTFIMTLNPV